MKTNKLWLGLTGIMTFFLTLMISVTFLANNYAGYINDFLGLNASSLALKGSQYADENGNLAAGYAQMLKDSYDFCIQEEEEGAVLLMNKDDALPLKSNERSVTLFGSNSAHIIYKSGAGGPAPNGSDTRPDSPDSRVISMKEAFNGAGITINDTLYEKYQDVTKWNIQSSNEAGPTFYTSAIRNALDKNTPAIVLLSRFGTEDTDPPKGAMQISQNERALLKLINDLGYTKIIVLLNGPLPMELGWLEEYNVDACLWFGNPGYYGLPGVVNLLKGENAKGEKITPSGKTVETFASDSEGAPAMQNFGNYTYTGDGGHYVVYKEGIYVGYKYYETRYEDKILNTAKVGNYDYAKEVCFPFGYGLSYTTFEQKLDSVTYNASADTITAKGTVKNTGTIDGKSVVQIWARVPYTEYDKQNGVEKSAVQIAGYEKVAVKAGETVPFEVTFDRYLLASWDTKFGNGGYILENGNYYFAVGNGAHEGLNNILGADGKSGLIDHDGKAYTAAAGTAIMRTGAELGVKGDIDRDAYKYSRYNTKEQVEVKNEFPDADVNYWANDNEKVTYLTRTDWEGTFPTTMTKLTANDKIKTGLNMAVYKAPADGPKYKEGEGTVYSVKLENPIVFSNMKNVPYDDPKWDTFVSQLSLNELIVSIHDQRSLAGVPSIKLPGTALVEGPEGLSPKFTMGDQSAATGFPTLPTVTASWDHAIQTEHGNRLGEEALFCGVQMVNAPGCNIIRTARSSRASEYMSEDGVLSYYSVSNIVKAAREKGLIMNVKHCFLNEQETNRQRVSTFSNEQAIREIYLKPFEGALTRGHGLGIMTSYNRIGLQYAATHATLMGTVLRKEWAYMGSIIDDALNPDANYCSSPDMLHAGTDIFCLDGGARHDQTIKNWIVNNNDGSLLKDLQEANKRIFYVLMHSSLGGAVDETTDAGGGAKWWQTMLVGIDAGFGVLTVGAAAMFVTFTYIKKQKEAK